MGDIPAWQASRRIACPRKGPVHFHAATTVSSTPNYLRTHLIPVDLAQRADVLLRVCLTAKPVEEVCTPLLGGDALSVEGLDVVFHVRQEVVQPADGAFEMEEEV